MVKFVLFFILVCFASVNADAIQYKYHPITAPEGAVPISMNSKCQLVLLDPECKLYFYDDKNGYHLITTIFQGESEQVLNFFRWRSDRFIAKITDQGEIFFNIWESNQEAFRATAYRWSGAGLTPLIPEEKREEEAKGNLAITDVNQKGHAIVRKRYVWNENTLKPIPKLHKLHFINNRGDVLGYVKGRNCLIPAVVNADGQFTIMSDFGSGGLILLDFNDDGLALIYKNNHLYLWDTKDNQVLWLNVIGNESSNGSQTYLTNDGKVLGIFQTVNVICHNGQRYWPLGKDNLEAINSKGDLIGYERGEQEGQTEVFILKAQDE